MMNIDNIRNESEEKVISVLRERESEITQHYKELRESVEHQKEIGARDEADCLKMMRKIKRNEFEALHELDILAMKFREAGVIDYRAQIWE